MHNIYFTLFFQGLQQIDEEIQNTENTVTSNNTGMGPVSQRTQTKRNISTTQSSASWEKKRRTKFDVMNKTMSNIRDILASDQTDETDSDECVAFGTYVGLQLKKLSSENRIYTQSSIQHILSDALLSEIRKTSRSRTRLSAETSTTITDSDYSVSDVYLAESPMVGENYPILTESDDAIVITIPEQNNDDQSDVSQSDILTQAKISNYT